MTAAVENVFYHIYLFMYLFIVDIILKRKKK